PAHPLSSQETVDRLLRLHFRDGRTRVHGDAQVLVAELLKVFVRGERRARCGPEPPSTAGPPPVSSPGGDLLPGQQPPPCPANRCLRPEEPAPSPAAAPPDASFSAEAAARAAQQAQAEDLEKVDMEHLEKVLPQLVRGR
ncbi:CENPX protein, partial [Trogon melanurus]|nr:CENPX protein [Trogon melanurus]